MNHNKLHFDCVIKFTQCCAELQRQGIAFNGGNTTGGFFVNITGY